MISHKIVGKGVRAPAMKDRGPKKEEKGKGSDIANILRVPSDNTEDMSGTIEFVPVFFFFHLQQNLSGYEFYLPKTSFH